MVHRHFGLMRDTKAFATGRGPTGNVLALARRASVNNCVVMQRAPVICSLTWLGCQAY